LPDFPGIRNASKMCNIKLIKFYREELLNNDFFIASLWSLTQSPKDMLYCKKR